MAEHEHKIEVTVRYIASTKPYSKDASPTETVGTLKDAALNFFGLVESGNKTYKLFHNKTELSNPNETIGQVAGDKKELKLELEEFITQGC